MIFSGIPEVFGRNNTEHNFRGNPSRIFRGLPEEFPTTFQRNSRRSAFFKVVCIVSHRGFSNFGWKFSQFSRYSCSFDPSSVSVWTFVFFLNVLLLSASLVLLAFLYYVDSFSIIWRFSILCACFTCFSLLSKLFYLYKLLKNFFTLRLEFHSVVTLDFLWWFLPPFLE